MRKILLSLAVLTLIVLVAGCNTPFTLPGQSAVAANINGKAITLADYQRQVELATNYLQNNGVDTKTPEGQQILEQMKTEVLDQMIDQEIINQAAAKEGLTVTNDDIDKEIADIVVRVGGQDKFDALLKASGFTKDELRQSIREQLTADKLFKKIVSTVTATADQVHARHILVKTKEEADAVVARLKKGEDFAKVAQEVSLDTGSKDDGGDLGFFSKGMMIPQFEQVAFALQPGKYSDPVQTEYGFHVILVVERDANHALSEDLLHANQQEAFTNWLDAQKSTSKIEKLVKPAATPVAK